MAVLIAAYTAFRFWGLTASCLWFDEIFSIHAAEHTWDTLFSFVALDLIHPPLFYVLLKLWIGIGGESLLWLRSFPVVFAVLALIPFIALCREHKLKFGTQLLAVLFFAVNGSLIKYSQEVRMYSLLLCLSLFSIWLFVRYFDRATGLVALVIVNVLLVYTHYFGWFVVGSEAVAILILHRSRWRPIAVMVAITLAAFIPWMVAVIQAARTGPGLAQNIGWMQRPGIGDIAQLKFALVEPFYHVTSSIDPLSVYRVSIPLMIIHMTVIILYITGWRRSHDAERLAVYLFSLAAVLPVVVVFAASWALPHSIWGTRHLIVVFAPVAILMAIAVTGLSTLILRTAAISMLVLFLGYGLVLQSLREKPEYIWCAWEQLVDNLDRTQPAKIYAYEDLTAYHLWFATRRSPLIQVFRDETLADIPEDAAYFLPRGFDGVGRIKKSDEYDSEFWAAFRTNAGDENASPLQQLRQSGYQPDAQLVVRLQGIDAVLVFVKKD